MSLKIGAMAFALVVIIGVAGNAYAVEMTGDAMMKKDGAMMKGDAMMKKDVMMSGASMMHEENLGLGSRGDKVVMIQKLLEEKGILVLPAGVAKGYFGQITKVAMMKYQAMLGVNNTGYYGPSTRAAMKAMMQKEVTMRDLLRQVEALQAQVMKVKEQLSQGDAMMKKDEAMMEKKNDSMMQKDDLAFMTKVGSYEAYSAEKIAKAATGNVVLFFRAGWCPKCREVDTDIKQNLKLIPANLMILDVNYDDSSALKQKYGVTYQHTFVQVDAQGNQIKKWSGSPTLAAIVAEVK